MTQRIPLVGGLGGIWLLVIGSWVLGSSTFVKRSLSVCLLCGLLLVSLLFYKKTAAFHSKTIANHRRRILQCIVFLCCPLLNHWGGLRLAYGGLFA